jgi:AraC-like DNA-binding protein
MEVCVEQQLYRLCQGDVVIIGSDLPHREQSLDTSFIHFQFDGNAFVDPGAWIRRAWSADARSNPFHGGCTFADNLRAKRMMARFIRQIDREMTGKSVGYEMAVDILIRRLLLALLRESRLSVLPAAEHVGMERLRPALDYIDRHLTGKIRVEELRRLTHCSYAHFVKYFKEVMGLPLVEYINGLRIRKAERLLLTEDMSVDQVAEEVGIPNIGHFYKLFRKMNGCTPGDFRNQ